MRICLIGYWNLPWWHQEPVHQQSKYWPSSQWIPHCLCRKDYQRTINSSSPGQNGHHFTDNIFRCISGNKSFVFWSKFHWSLFLGVENGLVMNRRQAIIWTNADSTHWRIYAALGGDEFMCSVYVCYTPVDGVDIYAILYIQVYTCISYSPY